MEENKDYYYCQRGTNGNENVNTALFTAGIVLLLVCLKRALLLFLVEQWRAWVFLVLNIVLLAIFFTSMNPNSSRVSHQEIGTKNDEEMKKKKSGNGSEVEACKEDQVLKSKTEEAEEKPGKEMVVEEENVELPNLSKEELNERVEAFIAMFRQHLASDGRKGRDKFYTERKQADTKKKHINLSSDEQKCFVLKVEG